MCGITALFSKSENIFPELYESLYHLQHRGQDSFGFSYFDSERKIHSIKKQGLLTNNIPPEVCAKIGLGHVRYPTFGKSDILECQPFFIQGKYHNISLIHNGQIEIDEIIKKIGVLNEDSSDSLYLSHYFSYLLNQYQDLNNYIILTVVEKIQEIKGAFNCICLIEDFGLICFKDKYNIRPLVLGKKNENYIISSESVSITSINYNLLGDIRSNSIILFNEKVRNIEILELYQPLHLKPCIFEWVYLAREESIIQKVNVYRARTKMGEFLANKIKWEINISDIDYVIPVPDTSKPIALEISKNLNKPYVEAITKNRYVNRTFIMNTNNKRKKNIKRKLNVINHLIKDKSILIVDDSIVRGNTIKHIINLLKDNEVKRIYVAICSPEIVNINKYGYDMPKREELISFSKSNKELEEILGVEKIVFQNLKDLKWSIQYYNSNITDFEMSIFEM